MEKKRYIKPDMEVLAISSDVWMAFSGSNTPSHAGEAKRRDSPF
jgi:hypothetical protein